MVNWKNRESRHTEQWECYWGQGCQYSSLQFPYSVPFAIWVWQNLDLQFRYTCQAFPAIWNGTSQVIAINQPAISNWRKVSSTDLGNFSSACYPPVLALHSHLVSYKESNHSVNFFRETQHSHYTRNFIVLIFLYKCIFPYISPTQLYSSSSGMWNALLCFASVLLHFPFMWHFWWSHFNQFLKLIIGLLLDLEKVQKNLRVGFGDICYMPLYPCVPARKQGDLMKTGWCNKHTSLSV